MQTKMIDKLGKIVSYKCKWNGKHITNVYLTALTDANFHSLRTKIAKLVNEELHTKLRITG